MFGDVCSVTVIIRSQSGITGVVLHPIMAMFSLSCDFSARDSGEVETDFVDRFFFLLLRLGRYQGAV